MMGTVSERDRVLLRRWADEHMDGKTADAFMNSTAPAGWDDFATKSDVAAVRADIERNREATEHAIALWREAHEKSIEQWREANEKAMEDLGARLTAMFTAQLAAEMLKVQEKLTGVHKQFAGVYEKIGDLGRAQRSQTVALVITILVAFFGQAALPHFLPPPTPPAPIVIELPGE